MTITPNILEETSRGIQSYAIEDMMLKNREIFLTSAINDQSAVDTIKQLDGMGWDYRTTAIR